MPGTGSLATDGGSLAQERASRISLRRHSVGKHRPSLLQGAAAAGAAALLNATLAPQDSPLLPGCSHCGNTQAAGRHGAPSEEGALHARLGDQGGVGGHFYTSGECAAAPMGLSNRQVGRCTPEGARQAAPCCACHDLPGGAPEGPGARLEAPLSNPSPAARLRQRKGRFRSSSKPEAKEEQPCLLAAPASQWVCRRVMW